MGDSASWLSRFMLSSRPWENWCREPQRRQEAENQAQGSYPEVLVEGNKRRGSAGSQVIVFLGDSGGNLAVWAEKGRQEAGRAGASCGSGSALEFRNWHRTHQPRCGAAE